MKFKADYIFDADLEKTLDICVHQVVGNIDYFKESYEDVADVKLLNLEKHDNGAIDVKMEFCAHGQIPKAAQSMIKPEMLTWQETSKWDPEKKMYIFNIKTLHFTKKITCKGAWKYSEKSPGKTLQACEGVLKINLPLIGGLVEKAVWQTLKKNWDQNYKDTKKKHGV